MTRCQTFAILDNMKNRNLLATFELSQGDKKTMETIAEAISHADHCFVKIVEHWRDDTESWNPYAIVQPSLAFVSSKGDLVLDIDHIVRYEFSGDRMYTTGVDCCKTISVGRSTDSTIYIYKRLPMKEIQPFIHAYKGKQKELEKSLRKLELDSKLVLNALGTSRLCLYR